MFPNLVGLGTLIKVMNQEATEQFKVLSGQEDIQTKLDELSRKLEIITITTNFMSNVLSFYIIYRSVSWVFR